MIYYGVKTFLFLGESNSDFYITFILSLLTICLFCLHAALGKDEDVVKKEEAQKDEFNWPWSKDKDKVRGGFVLYVCISTKMLRAFPEKEN